MRTETVKIPWPVSLNTVDEPRSLLDTECTENMNLIHRPNGNVRAHYRWDKITISGTIKMIWGMYVNVRNIKEQMLVFGQKSNSGFIGVIKKGESSLTVLSEAFAKYVVPNFVYHNGMIYIFACNVSGFDNTPTYDGEELEDSEIPQAMVGCSYRSRLFVSGIIDEKPGIVKFTEVGGLNLPTINYMPIGNINEPTTCLIDLPDSIIVGKKDEIWDIVYDTYIDEANIRSRSDKVGILSHRAATRDHNTIFCYNDKRVAIINPEQINVNPQQVLEVSPGVLIISKPIANEFEALNLQPPAFYGIKYQKIAGVEVGDEKWDINDFANYNDQGGVTTNGVTISICMTPPCFSFYESYAINLPENYTWGKIIADGIYTQGKSDIKLYVKIDGEDWRLVPKTTKENDISWDFNIWGDLKDAEKIYYKISVHISDLELIEWPILKNLKITIYSTVGAPLAGCGFHKDKFYIFAENQSGQRKNFVFDRNDGWLKTDQDGLIVYNLINDVVWGDDYNIVGFGSGKITKGGCLLKSLFDETYGNTMEIKGKTGQVDYKLPDIPKKLRRIMITYKGTGTIILTVADENGTIDTIILPEKSDFGIKEINFANVSRSKWHEFTIEASKNDFELADMRAIIKFFAPNEK